MQSTHSHQVTETREGHHTARLPSQSKLLLTCRGRVGALARVGSRSGASQCCGPACLCCGCGHGLAGCGCWTYGGTWGEGTATQETCSLQSLHAADVAAGHGRWQSPHASANKRQLSLSGLACPDLRRSRDLLLLLSRLSWRSLQTMQHTGGRWSEAVDCHFYCRAAPVARSTDAAHAQGRRCQLTQQCSTAALLGADGGPHLLSRLTRLSLLSRLSLLRSREPPRLQACTSSVLAHSMHNQACGHMPCWLLLLLTTTSQNTQCSTYQHPTPSPVPATLALPVARPVSTKHAGRTWGGLRWRCSML